MDEQSRCVNNGLLLELSLDLLIEPAAPYEGHMMTPYKRSMARPQIMNFPGESFPEENARNKGRRRSAAELWHALETIKQRHAYRASHTLTIPPLSCEMILPSLIRAVANIAGEMEPWASNTYKDEAHHKSGKSSLSARTWNGSGGGRSSAA